MEEQIKFIKDYLNGCKAIFNGKNLEDTDKALTILAEIETELKKLRVADVSGRSEQLFCEEHTPKVRYDWQKGTCLTCAKELKAK
jgi:hypothetical protein